MITSKTFKSTLTKVATFWGAIVLQVLIAFVPLIVLRGGWAAGWLFLFLLTQSFFITYLWCEK
jgi:hypothetical protein